MKKIIQFTLVAFCLLFVGKLDAQCDFDQYIHTDLNNQTLDNVTYYIANDITIYGRVAFNDADIIIEDGVTITVAPGARLDIFGSHLHTCSGNLWNGILVDLDINTGDVGCVNINGHYKSSLIENANAAVNFQLHDVYSTSTAHHDFLLNVQNTIFNKNLISININDLNSTESNRFPIYIYGNVFTCRKIETTRNYWPNVKDYKMSGRLTATVRGFLDPPASKAAPYIEDDLYPFDGNDAFVSTGPNEYTKSQAGIKLNNCGFAELYNSGYEILIGRGDARYNDDMRFLYPDDGGYCIDLGDEEYNPTMNLFDYQKIGIDASSSTLTSINNTFQRGDVERTKSNYIGIKQIDYGGPTNREWVKVIRPADDNATNAFYNMTIGVNAILTYCVQVNNTYMNSEDRNDNSYGHNGVLVDNGEYEENQFNYNHFESITYAVKFDANGGDVHGNVSANYNNFVGYFVDKTISGAILCNSIFGIMMNEIAPATQTYGTAVANSNTFNYDHAITFSNWQYKDCKAVGNNIDVVWEGIACGYAIQLTNCIAENSTVYDNGNFVYGNYLTVTSLPYITYANTGIEIRNSSNTQVRCNTIKKFSRNVAFINENRPARFWGNTLSYTNAGLYLDDAIIGTQGAPAGVASNAPNGFGANNMWLNPLPGEPSWGYNSSNGETYYKTYTGTNLLSPTTNSDANNSPMYIIDDPSIPEYNPDGFGGSSNNTITPYIISPFNTIRTLPVGNGTTYPNVCYLGDDPNDGENFMRMQKGTSNSHTTDTLLYQAILDAEKLALGIQPIYNTDSVARRWVMQQQLFTSLLSVNNLMLSRSQILQQFVQNNAQSSFAKPLLADSLLAKKDSNALASLLSSWTPVNSPDNNNWNYYNLSLKLLKKQQLQSADSSLLVSLAKGCPIVDGRVVYRSRNLYNYVYRTDSAFASTCTNTNIDAPNTAFKQIIVKNNTDNLGVSVYPNPNKGNFTIKLNKPMGKIHVLIYNTMGNVVYEKNVIEQAQNVSVQTQLTKGVYVLKLLTEKAILSTTKLVIE